MKKYFLAITVLFALMAYPAHVFAADTSTLQTQLAIYLPYILIGGAAILLVSIVGILLSKKKDKVEEEVTPTAPTATETPMPVTNSEIETPAPVPPVNMDEISNSLYTPEVASKPTIQETMESTSLETPQVIQPESPEATVPVTEQTQNTDLADILQGEASASPMGPVTSQPAEEAVTTEAPAEEVVPPMPTTPAEPLQPMDTPAVEIAPTEVPDLQQFINNQVAAVPAVETPEPVTTPMQDFNPTSVDTSAPVQTDTPPTVI